MDPDISIVVPSCNKAKYISETLNSVISQTFRNFEVIIIDDASDDDTVDRLKPFIEIDDRFQLIINTANKGANYCRNYGLSLAKSRWILFLDADDLLEVGCLGHRMEVVAGDDITDVIVFTMGVFRKKVYDDFRKWKPRTRHPLKDFVAHNLPWQTMQPLWKRETLMQLGGFDETFQKLQDVELHTRALLRDDLKFVLVESEPDCFYRINTERTPLELRMFLSKWIDAAIQYCTKFEVLLKEDDRKLLTGTIFQAYLKLIFHFRNGEISMQEFRTMEGEVINLKFFKKPRSTENWHIEIC